MENLHTIAVSLASLWFLRFDPEVRDRWPEIEEMYEKRVEFDLFHAYANLIYAFRQHPELNKFRKPYYFMDDELQLSALNPFIYVWGYDVDEVTQLYDDLVEVIKDNVESEYIMNYYRTLSDSHSELQGIISRH